MKSSTWIIIVAAVLSIGAAFFLPKCGDDGGNTIVEGPVPTVPTIVYVTKDSVLVREQEVLIIQSQKTINRLKDSLAIVSTKLASIVPQLLIQYSDTFRIQQEAILKTTSAIKHLEDSINLIWASISDRDTNVAFVALPKTFNFGTKDYKIAGILNKNSKIVFDTIDIYNSTSIVVGKKGSWWQDKTLVVTVANSNPYIKGSGLKTYEYKAKPKKLGLLVGPSFIFDTKDKKFRPGVGVTAGYRIF